MSLLQVTPVWVQLLDEGASAGRLTVLELDDAVVAGAPYDDFGVQLSVSVALHDPDHEGQPYDDEQAVLGGLRRALDAALTGQGRVVATITMGGVRELIAYVRTAAVVQAWQHSPPAGFGTHDLEFALLEDPGWLGLREIAGLLGDQQAPLRPPS